MCISEREHANGGPCVSWSRNEACRFCCVPPIMAVVVANCSPLLLLVGAVPRQDACKAIPLLHGWLEMFRGDVGLSHAETMVVGNYRRCMYVQPQLTVSATCWRDSGCSHLHQK